MFTDDLVMYACPGACEGATSLPLITSAMLTILQRTYVSIQGCDLLLAKMGLRSGQGQGEGESREENDDTELERCLGCQETRFFEPAQAPLLIKM